MYLVGDVLSALSWLNDWPVGLKLNTPLSAFLCSAFGQAVQVWDGENALLFTRFDSDVFRTDLVSPNLPAISMLFTQILAFSCLAGLTMGLSVLRDIIYLSTTHLRLSYLITKAICALQLDSLGGLWNLFRGQYSLQCYSTFRHLHHKQGSVGTSFVFVPTLTPTKLISYSWAPCSSQSRSSSCRQFWFTQLCLP